MVQTGPANQRDEQLVEPLLKTMPPVQGPRGRPRSKPTVLQGDAAYGFPWIIAAVIAMRIESLLKRRGKDEPHGSGLGKSRYVVERTFSWFGNHRRIKLCYERTGKHFQAFNELAACAICANRLRKVKLRF